jgi:hypothetical protein
LNADASDVESKHDDDHERVPNFAISCIDLEPDSVKAVNQEDMATLRDYFLNLEPYYRVKDLPQAVIYKVISPEGFNHIFIEARWRGLTVTIFRKSAAENSRSYFKFLSRTTLNNLNFSIPDIVTKEWQIESPTREEGDGTVWRLGMKGWRAFDLIQLSVTQNGRPLPLRPEYK